MKWPKSLEEFWETNIAYSKELQELRAVILECGLDEQFKWAFPTYTWKNKNIVAIGSFKNHYALWFFQGVFLKDKLGVLTNAQEGKTKAMRHWKVENGESVDLELVKAYVLEAVENQKAGKVMKVTKDTSYDIPEVLKQELGSNSSFYKAFYELSPAKQKEYANYLNEAKQDATKERRLNKIIPLVLSGVGLNDKYK